MSYRLNGPLSPNVARWPAVVMAAFASLLLPTLAAGQASTSGSTGDDAALRVRLPTVTVTAQKEEEDRQRLPVSVTAASRETIDAAGIRIISDAAILAPNTFFTEWSARKLSTARFRGIGSSPNNPAITTYVDGVPQLNEISSSVELLDVDQIEFVRGPQSALFGRNTLGGLINVTSARPARDAWTGSFAAPFGNHVSWAVRGGVSGPVVQDKVSVGVSLAQVTRDGFTVNDITGNVLDDRSAFSSKAQLVWTPTEQWEARVIFSSERARDGDYSLNDIGRLRADPFHAARDFEGSVDRDVVATTIQTRRAGEKLVFSTTTGFVNWTTRDITDLDYTPASLLRRDNTEEDLQFSQEVRLASSDSSPVRLGDRARAGWQGGVFVFAQRYRQDAVNSYAPFLIAPVAVDQHTPLSELDDVGVGVFGQGTVTIGERLDLTAGARVDYEDKSARLETFFEQPLGFPATLVEAEQSFSNVSPQAAIAYRVRADKTVYATVGRGYKAGGFNSASPIGSESYGEERAWHLEGGLKSLWGNGRVSANAAVFYIDWSDLQFNVPDPAVPAQFFIANVGGAVSKGVELELGARAARSLDLFAAAGYTHARFAEGSISRGASVEGNALPSTPEYTASVGVQYTRRVRSATLQGRADLMAYGSFEYDDQNTIGQDAYSLVNLRFVAAGRYLFGELFVRNAFDTRYIPLAFAYGSFAPSGFVGEMGAPRTLGASVGVRF